MAVGAETTKVLFYTAMIAVNNFPALYAFFEVVG